MELHSRATDEGRSRFGYFVLHAQRVHEDEAQAGLRVTIEDLRTGEKRSFDSSGELQHFLDEWAGKLTGDLRFRAPKSGGEE